MFVHIQEKYLSEAFDVKYILTKKLNIIKIFWKISFYIRYKIYGKWIRSSHTYGNTTQTEMTYLKYSEHVLLMQRNTEEDNCKSLINMIDVHGPDT